MTEIDYTIMKLQFYADKPGEYNNKLFTFECKNSEKAEQLLCRFMKSGNQIRSAFLKFKFDLTGEGQQIHFNQEDLKRILNQYSSI